MAKKQIFTEETLKAMNLIKNKDGSYSKAKTTQQPREVKNYEKDHIDDIKPNEEFRKISLVLLGEPMSKQSVRATKSGHFFQPKKYTDREKDYRRQIKEQLPKDFNMFTEEVQIVKMHIVYAPLKGFQKIKGMMDRIRSGEMIKKLTKPDLPDNCKKLVLDSMSELVYKDDSIIWAEDNVRKFYSTGGAIIIEIIGK
jgi:Holliday junction resolvase RusA-like endonuclease